MSRDDQELADGDAMSELDLDSRNGIAVLTLNAPHRRNALTVELAAALARACDDIDADESIGAVVIRSNGFFCAGGDRATLAAAGEDPADPVHYQGVGMIYGAFARVGALLAPTIAAVRGGAVGAGLNLMLAADLRVVARDARLVSGFMPIGLHPGGGHGALIGRAGGRDVVAAMMLFGEEISGARAAEVGLAWAAVEDADVEALAFSLAERPASDPELARRTTASMRVELGPPALSWPASVELERASQMWSMRRAAVARRAG